MRVVGNMSHSVRSSMTKMLLQHFSRRQFIHRLTSHCVFSVPEGEKSLCQRGYTALKL